MPPTLPLASVPTVLVFDYDSIQDTICKIDRLKFTGHDIRTPMPSTIFARFDSLSLLLIIDIRARKKFSLHFHTRYRGYVMLLKIA